MLPRLLFGPIDGWFAEQNLGHARQSGQCLTFGYAPGTDLIIGPAETWEQLQARFPTGWQPDGLALWLPYTTVPAALWQAPLPTIGLAADWNLVWHTYKRIMALVDVIITDSPGIAVMERAGWPQARAAHLFGCERYFLEAPAVTSRDIDVLFVGNLHAAVQSSRLPWIARLAKLADRWNVVIRTGVFGAEYRELLGRSRIVFNRSIRGECNRRVFETIASGALLFQEADNAEVTAWLRPGEEYVPYTDHNLEARLTWYLEHEDERQRIAEAAHARAGEFTFERLWQDVVTGLEADWPALVERARQRAAQTSGLDLLGRTWQALSASSRYDETLRTELQHAVGRQPAAASLHNALGLVQALEGDRVAAARAFRSASEVEPTHGIAGLNQAEALAAVGQQGQASSVARVTLSLLDREAFDPACLDEGHFPPGFARFRVEWERAAWSHAGDPRGEQQAKQALLRWRLHTLLAEQTGDLAHAWEAALARPDLPETQTLLGTLLQAKGWPEQAVPHLRQALASNPFDVATARQLAEAYQASEQEGARRALARERRRLAQAAPQVVPSEPWFAQTPPVGDELASLVLLCCNAVDYTRLCLESVLRHTRAPYELIVVDNASTDETPALLAELRERPGPARVVVLRNETNVGFPAGCNQALTEARGDYVVFLNNDTVVTPGWLADLIAWSLHDWPSVGLVGPMSNGAPPPQQVEPEYQDLADLDPFAARRRQTFARQATAVERLTGFCLLVRRAVLDQIGGFDERFGHGFFEDDDLGLRAQHAGFRLLLAHNVYIHHFGSRTFQALGLDGRQQLEVNLERFRAKWGAKRAAGYRLVEPPPPATPEPLVVEPTATTSGVSLCLIVRNEEANLPDCLASVADLVQEIIVVDTGSTDRTRAIAAGYGARVVEFPWIDSFAAARNESLRHATREWIFWMDADDRLDEPNREKLRRLFAGLDGANVGYALKCLCLADPITRRETVVDHIRLFRNHPAIRWRYRVHEQILGAVKATGGDVRWGDVVIHHVGYLDPALRRRKLDRDLRLLQLEDAEHPDDPFTLFNLGSVYQELRDCERALPLLQRSLQLSHVRDSIVRKLYVMCLQCHITLGQHDQALTACRAGLTHYPDDTELLFHASALLEHEGHEAEAEQCLLLLLDQREAEHFASLDPGLRGYKARHNLALLYLRQGRQAEAESQWQQALAEQPDFAPARLGLAELYLTAGRWADLDAVLAGLGEGAEAELDRQVFQARRQLACADFPAARTLLEEACRQHPQALPPRVFLSHVLLQEGRDWPAAEAALLAILTLDPAHAQARQNLAALRSRRNGIAAPALSLAQLYAEACQTPSDINEHCPTLYALARQCRHVTEMGTRTGISTIALLFAQPDTLVCYDQRRWPQVDRLAVLAGRTRFIFQEADVRTVEIEPTDLLFIDTWHVYEQLQIELRLHPGRVRRFVVLHDTTTFGTQGETAGHRGLWPALEEFLAAGIFRLHEHYPHNHGLTVLERLISPSW